MSILPLPNLMREDSCDVISLTSDWTSPDEDERFLHRVSMFTSSARLDEMKAPCSPTKQRRIMQQKGQVLQDLIVALNSNEDDSELIEPDSESSDDAEDESSAGARDVIVRGEDIGEVPVTYTVRGIHCHEFPAIGQYI
jgi:hypothetical protein